MKIVMILLSSILFAFAGDGSKPQEIDGIVAVVGDSVILHSEINGYVDMKMQQSGSEDLLLKNIVRARALDELIDSKVMSVYADKDTNIVITSSEIFDQVEKRVNMICTQNKITREQLAAALEREQGITYTEFRAQMENQVRQELVKQKVEQFYLVGGQLSREEVHEFFTTYQDSLPPAGESVRLQKIEVSLSADSSLRSNTYDEMMQIRKLIVDKNRDFSEVAKEFSQGPNASRGGDLGFIAKGTLTLVKLEQKLFSLSPGEVSEPIETKLGWHLITTLERRDNKVHALHIFIPVAPSAAKEEEVQAVLDSIHAKIIDSTTFVKAVAFISTDAVTRAYDGDMGWQLAVQVQPEIRENFGGLFLTGALSKVFKIDNSYFIYRVISYDKSRRMTFEDDYSSISRYAAQVDNKDKLKDLIKSWRKDVFIKRF